MPRRLDTPEVIFSNRRKLNGEGHKLTHRKLAEIAATDFQDYPESTDRSILLAQAASQLLRTKRSKAMGHPNGRRNYTSADRMGKGLPGGAKVHGSRPNTIAKVAR